jgi:TetR/AcrR family transcriptional regulator
MLSDTFHRLPPERQQRVLDAAMREFTQHGYEAASTNRMVRSLGIAKGTLFKYAPTKEMLYLHIYEQVITELARLQNDPGIYRSPDLFERVEELFEALLDYAAREPLRYRFSMRASLDTAASVHAKVESMRRSLSGQHMGAMLAGVDWRLYAMPRLELLELFTWVMAGARAAAIPALGVDFDHDAYVALMRKQLSLMRRLVRGGVYRIPPEEP